MRASAAIDDHQGAFWGGHLNAGGVATITKCASPGSGKRAPGSPELDLHTRRINAHSACSHMPSPATTDVGVRTDSTFLLSSPFVHPVCRAPAREWSEWDERNRRVRAGLALSVRVAGELRRLASQWRTRGIAIRVSEQFRIFHVTHVTLVAFSVECW